MSSSLFSIFKDIEDPRIQGRTVYPLMEILFLCITAILSGAEGWEAIEDFKESCAMRLNTLLSKHNLLDMTP